MKFEVTPEQKAKVDAWLKDTVYPAMVERQKESFKKKWWGSSHPIPAGYQECWEMGYPYEGAIGGGVTYEFTPNSIGESLWVSYSDEFRLDLTDYGIW